MNKEKLGYESPSIEILELRFEGMVCASGDGVMGVDGFTNDLEILDFGLMI